MDRNGGVGGIIFIDCMFNRGSFFNRSLKMTTQK